jgi:hypothetical protein
VCCVGFLVVHGHTSGISAGFPSGPGTLGGWLALCERSDVGDSSEGALSSGVVAAYEVHEHYFSVDVIGHSGPSAELPIPVPAHVSQKIMYSAHGRCPRPLQSRQAPTLSEGTELLGSSFVGCFLGAIGCISYTLDGGVVYAGRGFGGIRPVSKVSRSSPWIRSGQARTVELIATKLPVRPRLKL